jgi:hypothetical protein
MRDEAAQQAHGATLGSCLSEYRDHMVNGLLSVLAQAQQSDARFIVIEAVPSDQQVGPDQTFWWVHENEWPVPRTAAPAARSGW